MKMRMARTRTRRTTTSAASRPCNDPKNRAPSVSDGSVGALSVSDGPIRVGPTGTAQRLDTLMPLLEEWAEQL